MSASGVKYAVEQVFENTDRVFAYYDFADVSYTGTYSGSASVFTGFLENQFPARDTGLYSAKIIDSIGTFSEATGVYSDVLIGGKLDLTKSNVEINCGGMNFQKFTALVDFEFKEGVTDGVLFGSLEKTSDVVGSETITGSKGFNFGVNGRGKPFFQSFGKNGDSIHTFNDVELSKRNILSFSIDGRELHVGYYDFINSQDKNQTFRIDKDYMIAPDSLFLGGSKTYYKTDSESGVSFSGYLNEIAFLSGYFPRELNREIGSGIFGDYFQNSGSVVTGTFITGYTTTIVYKTGITGFSNTVTGQLTITTGYAPTTGSFTLTGTMNRNEGERYSRYYSVSNGTLETTYQEEVGVLETGIYTYNPTGDGAHATLGLGSSVQSIPLYSLTTGRLPLQTTIDLYDNTGILTGVTTQISGVTQTPLYGTSEIEYGPTSGLSAPASLEGVNKDFIYYMGERI